MSKSENHDEYSMKLLKNLFVNFFSIRIADGSYIRLTDGDISDVLKSGRLVGLEEINISSSSTILLSESSVYRLLDSCPRYQMMHHFYCKNVMDQWQMPMTTKSRYLGPASLMIGGYLRTGIVRLTRIGGICCWIHRSMVDQQQMPKSVLRLAQPMIGGFERL